jgi:hypothetical protein
MEPPGQLDHPALWTAIGTIFSYGLILVVMTLLIFVIPYLIFLGF